MVVLPTWDRALSPALKNVWRFPPRIMQFHLYRQFPAVIRRHYLVQTQRPMAIPRRHSMVSAQFISAFLAAVSFQAGIPGTDHLAIAVFPSE